MNQKFQDDSGQSTEYAYEESKNEHEILLLYVAVAPQEKFHEPILDSIIMLYFFHIEAKLCKKF